MSPEAWAGWAQAVGSIAAILGAAWGVQRAHTLQSRADSQRQLRALALEFESIERLFAEILVSLRVVEAVMIEREQFDEHMYADGTKESLREYVQALDLVEPTFAAKPHLALQFVRGRNIALAAIAMVLEIPTWSTEGVREGAQRLSVYVSRLADVHQSFRDDRELYEEMSGAWKGK